MLKEFSARVDFYMFLRRNHFTHIFYVGLGICVRDATAFKGAQSFFKNYVCEREDLKLLINPCHSLAGKRVCQDFLLQAARISESVYAQIRMRECAYTYPYTEHRHYVCISFI